MLNVVPANIECIETGDPKYKPSSHLLVGVEAISEEPIGYEDAYEASYLYVWFSSRRILTMVLLIIHRSYQ